MPEREQARAKRPPMRGNHPDSLSFVNTRKANSGSA
jgi:hypothetical protein